MHIRFGSSTANRLDLEATSEDKLIAPLIWSQQLKRVFNTDITIAQVR